MKAAIRKNNGWTAQVDAATFRVFMKYGSDWAKIHETESVLSNRTPERLKCRHSELRNYTCVDHFGNEIVDHDLLAAPPTLPDPNVSSTNDNAYNKNK